MTQVLNKFGILPANQHDFKEDKCIGTALFEYVHCLYNKIDNKEYPLSVFWDLTTAFDNANILLRKLDIYGVKGVALDWVTG